MISKKLSFKAKIGISIFLIIVAFNNLFAQTSGEFIPLSKTYPDSSKGDPEFIRGNMVIIGSSILGVDDETHDPNDEYDIEVSSGGQTRAYIDIDSDPDRDTKYTDGGFPIYQNLLSTESEYSGIPGTLSEDGTTLLNNEPILDNYGAPNYGKWLDDTPSLAGPFLPGVEEGTFSSSAAELKINNSSNGSCSKIQRAYLYWSGLYTGEQFVSNDEDTPISNKNYRYVTRERPDCIDENGNPCELYTDIKILPPGGSTYYDIKFNNSGNTANSLKSEILYDDTWSRELNVAHSIYNKSSTIHPTAPFNTIPEDQGWIGQPSYACRADITPLMQNLQDSRESVEGFWTVANIRTTVGSKLWGLGAGWSIVLVYEDPLESQKNITFYDGYVSVINEGVTTTLDGFQTPPAGPINVEFASLSIEGDARLYSDNIAINGTKISATKPAGVNSDIGYDSSNFFDSSITSIDRSTLDLFNLKRFPNSLVNLGFDSDHFIVDNTDNSIIGNSDTSATINLSAGDFSNDQTSTYFTAISIEVLSPEIQLINTVSRSDGSELPLDEVIDLGEEIIYTSTIANNGNAEAINTLFTDILPINTVFNPETANFSVSPPLPAGYEFTYDSNYESGEIDTNGDPILTTKISLEIPDSIDTANGEGFLEPNDQVNIQFSVNVVSDCRLLRNACSSKIENQSYVEFASILDPGTLIHIDSAFEMDDCGTPINGPTITFANQTACNSSTIVEILCIEEPLEISAGNGFDIYEWYVDNPFGTPYEIGVFDANDIPFTNDAIGDTTLNQQEVMVLDSGFYHVYQEISGVDCQRVSLTYEIQGLDFFDTNIDPFANAATKNELLCPDTNVVEVTEILICDLTDTVTLGSTEYPVGTDVTWQRLDDSAGCTKSNDLCSYPDTSTGGAPCFAPSFSTNHTETFDFNDEGVYKLTVSLNGGCPFEYYFNIISYGVTPDINVASGGECNSGDVVIELSGVDLDIGGNLDGYSVDFVTLDTSNNIVSILVDDSTTPSITIPASAGDVRVQAIVKSDNSGTDSCTYASNIVPVTFFNLEVDNVNITREPTCFEDRASTTTYDDSKGDVRIDLTGDSDPFYYYYLRNTADNSISQLSGQQGTDYYEFEDVDPGNYVIEAFSSSNTIATTDPIPNCTVVSNPFEIIEVPGYRAVISTQQLSCNPAQITLTVEALDPNNPINYNDIIVNFTDANDNSNFKSFSYSADGSTAVTFTVDDSSVIVTTIDPDTGDFITTDSGADMYIDDLYTNESGTNPLDNNIQIQVFNSSCPLDIPNVIINPFEKLELTIDLINTKEPSCSDFSDGRIAISAFGDNLIDITGYEIIDAFPDYSFIGSANSSGVFDNLPAGDYTIEASQSVGQNICNATIDFTLTNTNENCPVLSNPELEKEAANISIYPLPAKNTVTINNISSLKMESIEVYNITGELLITESTELNEETLVDISDLKAGVYIAKINTEKGKIIKKVIKK